MVLVAKKVASAVQHKLVPSGWPNWATTDGQDSESLVHKGEEEGDKQKKEEEEERNK